MSNSHEYTEPFDFAKARKSVEDFRLATGVGCFLIDSQGYPLTPRVENEVRCVCGTCGPREGGPSSEEARCREIHLYGAYQAEQFGGRYMYFCNVSLLYWASPIIIDGMMQGALIGGPALLISHEEAEQEIRHAAAEGDPELEDLSNKIKNIPLLTPRRSEALMEVLFTMALGLSDSESAQIFREEEHHRQQSKVGEYIHYLKSMGGDESNFDGYSLEKEKALQSRIAKGDRLGAQAILNEIIGSILYAVGNDLDVMKARVLELTVLLSRAALEGGAEIEQIFGLNYKYLNQIHRFTTMEELIQWLGRILNRFSDFVFAFRDVKHTDVIYKSFEYIQRNLSGKITLDEVAAHVYLSPTYFSKIFKEEVKTSFSSYVNSQRIDKSKELLNNSKLSLVEVAGLVGFEDQSYFNKVFKRHTGVSPGKYREKRGIRFLPNPEIHE